MSFSLASKPFRCARVPGVFRALLLAAAIVSGPPVTLPARASVPLIPVSGTPPGGLQSYPALASLGSTLFAAWSDGREGALDRLYWTHFTGDPPDSLAAPLTTDVASELHAALASGSGWALAAWESWTTTGTRLAAARVDGPGVPGSRDVTRITSGPGPVRRPALAVLENVAVIVWEDERIKPGDLYCAIWERTEGLRDPEGVPFATGAGFRSHVRVAAAPGGFLVVWTESTEALVHRVLVRAIGEDGIPADSTRAISRDLDSATEADVVAMGSRWLVVWREPGSGGSDLVGRFADSRGMPLGSGPFSIAASPGFEYGPRLAAMGEAACLIWFDHDVAGRGLRRAWVDASGGVHPAGGLALTDPADHVADAVLAVRGTEAVAAWRLPLPLDDDDLYSGVFPVADTTLVPVPVPLALVADVTGVGPSRRGSPIGIRASPNPFRHGVRLDGGDPAGSNQLVITDVCGRRVRHLGIGSAGQTHFWDGRTDRGEPAPPGVYLAKIIGNRRGLRLVKLP